MNIQDMNDYEIILRLLCPNYFLFGLECEDFDKCDTNCSIEKKAECELLNDQFLQTKMLDKFI